MAKDILPPSVVEALRSGNKIVAIKRLREITGQSLKDSKDWIDSYLRTHVEPPPEPQFGRPEGHDHDDSFFAHKATPAHKPVAHPHVPRPGLGPGEVPRGGGSGKWLALFAAGLVAVLAALHFR